MRGEWWFRRGRKGNFWRGRQGSQGFAPSAGHFMAGNTERKYNKQFDFYSLTCQKNHKIITNTTQDILKPINPD